MWSEQFFILCYPNNIVANTKKELRMRLYIMKKNKDLRIFATIT
ncbi:hypothetical protein BH18THE2_BH18THE2_37610 [soil metagenome]